MKIFLIGFLLLLQTAFAFDVPPFSPNIVDTSGTLTTESVERLNLQIQDILHSKNVRPAILIIPSLNGETIEEVAEKTFRVWGIGEAKKDNGILIVVAIEDRMLRIEVGYGLEGEITDYFTSVVRNDFMNPAFRLGNYERGLSQGLMEISKKVTGTSTIRSEDPTGEYILERSITWLVLFFLLPALLQTLAYAVAKSKNTFPYQQLIKVHDHSPRSFRLGGGFAKGTVFLKLFVTANPGIFFVIFPPVFEDPELTFGMNIAMGICIFLAWFFSVVNVLRLFSTRVYDKVKSIQEKTKSHSGSSSSSSSSSSHSSSRSSSGSSSSSSSSGGGRSGGGGSSGRW